MRIAVSLLVAVTLSACGGGGSSSGGTGIAFNTVAQTQYSGVSAREEVVVRSQSEFNLLWARYSARLVSPPPAPVLDFNAVQVVGVFLGTRPDGCYNIAITSVMQTADRLVVAYEEQVQPPGSGCTFSLVYPAHLVAVQASQLDVEFVME